MTLISDILEHNKAFVEDKAFEPLSTSKFPDKKMVVLTCMDARLIELLPRALNLRNGDAKVIKNAGGVVTEPFGSTMQNILLAIYDLQADEVLVVGHTDCGAHGVSEQTFTQKAKQRGIREEVMDTLTRAGMDLDQWFKGFDRTVKESVVNSVEIIRNHPLKPQEVPVHGFIIDSSTGKLNFVSNGYRD